MVQIAPLLRIQYQGFGLLDARPPTGSQAWLIVQMMTTNFQMKLVSLRISTCWSLPLHVWLKCFTKQVVDSSSHEDI